MNKNFIPFVLVSVGEIQHLFFCMLAYKKMRFLKMIICWSTEEQKSLIFKNDNFLGESGQKKSIFKNENYLSVVARKMEYLKIIAEYLNYE